MDGRIRVKMGQIEIECEGSEKFLEKELVSILSAISDFYQSAPSELKQAQVSDPISVPNTEKNTQQSAQNFDLAINSVATKLGATKGSDLLLAAMARLTFGENKDVFSDAEIKAELKLATQHKSATALKHFTVYMKSLCGAEKIYDKGSAGFALSANTRQELSAQLKD